MLTETQEDRTQLVHTFPKNERETVRVAFTEFKGRQLIDLRTFFVNSRGESHPTPKGLTISRELLPELEHAVAALRAADSEASRV